ncbi:MAG: 50S ribosomal protein L21 [Acidobacteria bacterium]|nr:50S ribosomal protein L21 [Acidobacteriota bacterium]
MYAVIETGGKQYRVAPGDVIRVESLPGEKGSEGEFGRVLAVSSEEGKILTGEAVAQAKVEATILSHARGRKVLVFHFKRKKQYKKTRGHRQNYTMLRVDQISLSPGETLKAPPKTSPAPAKKAAPKASPKAPPKTAKKASAKPAAKTSAPKKQGGSGTKKSGGTTKKR